MTGSGVDFATNTLRGIVGGSRREIDSRPLPLEMLNTITFALAFAAFGVLAAAAIGAAHGRLPRALSIAVAVLAVAHVALVWTFRYEGSLAVATRNGYFGFAIFHVALLALCLAVAVRPSAARRGGRGFRTAASR